MQIAARLRTETILTIKSIAARLHLGTTKSTDVRLNSLKERNNGSNSLVQSAA